MKATEAAPAGAPANPLFDSVSSHPCCLSSLDRHDKNGLCRVDAAALSFIMMRFEYE